MTLQRETILLLFKHTSYYINFHGYAIVKNKIKRLLRYGVFNLKTRQLD